MVNYKAAKRIAAAEPASIALVMHFPGSPQHAISSGKPCINSVRVSVDISLAMDPAYVVVPPVDMVANS
eukprot:CAMPEP_0169277220 /NCGR_PEP_ID=MMETSP1016-20121227/53532_1 /TAXON_ID=342587 /ORGANISM="Karlodinium micrum, Strain CCMP2283" /LENGTH=68 /DNA_ID=CAMNT_0009364613 /DNA_START=328 /DNA_END=534 /DNA_ORIENTATION=+